MTAHVFMRLEKKNVATNKKKKILSKVDKSPLKFNQKANAIFIY